MYSEYKKHKIRENIVGSPLLDECFQDPKSQRWRTQQSTHNPIVLYSWLTKKKRPSHNNWTISRRLKRWWIHGPNQSGGKIINGISVIIDVEGLFWLSPTLPVLIPLSVNLTQAAGVGSCLTSWCCLSQLEFSVQFILAGLSNDSKV